MLRLELWLKMGFISKSMVSWAQNLVKKTSYILGKFLERFPFLIRETKEQLVLQE